MLTPGLPGGHGQASWAPPTFCYPAEAVAELCLRGSESCVPTKPGSGPGGMGHLQPSQGDSAREDTAWSSWLGLLQHHLRLLASEAAHSYTILAAAVTFSKCSITSCF